MVDPTLLAGARPVGMLVPSVVAVGAVGRAARDSELAEQAGITAVGDLELDRLPADRSVQQNSEPRVSMIARPQVPALGECSVRMVLAPAGVPKDLFPSDFWEFSPRAHVSILPAQMPTGRVFPPPQCKREDAASSTQNGTYLSDGHVSARRTNDRFGLGWPTVASSCRTRSTHSSGVSGSLWFRGCMNSAPSVTTKTSES